MGRANTSEMTLVCLFSPSQPRHSEWVDAVTHSVFGTPLQFAQAHLPPAFSALPARFPRKQSRAHGERARPFAQLLSVSASLWCPFCCVSFSSFLVVVWGHEETFLCISVYNFVSGSVDQSRLAELQELKTLGFCPTSSLDQGRSRLRRSCEAGATFKGGLELAFPP